METLAILLSVAVLGLIVAVGSLLIVRRNRDGLLIQNALDTAHITVLATTLESTGKSLDQSRSASKAVMDLFLVRTVEVGDLKEEVGRLERELAQQEELLHVLQASTPVRDERGRFSKAAGLLDGIFGDGESNDSRGSDRESGQASLSAGGSC